MMGDDLDATVWKLRWECSEALEHLLGCVSDLLKCPLELGAGLGDVTLMLQSRGVVDAVATDGEIEAVNEMTKKGVKNARVLWWNDTSFSGSHDLVFGSDLLYSEEGMTDLFGLLARIDALCVVITSAPVRKPFFLLVEKLTLLFDRVVMKRVELPNCEPALAVVAVRNDSVSEIFNRLSKIILENAKEAVVMMAENIPPPPPLPH
jgi:hypothetical protein